MKATILIRVGLIVATVNAAAFKPSAKKTGPVVDPLGYITSFYDIWARQAAPFNAAAPTGPTTACGNACSSCCSAKLHTCSCTSCSGCHTCSCGSCGSCGSPCSGCQQCNCGPHVGSPCCSNLFGNKNEETTLDGFAHSEDSISSQTATTAHEPASQATPEHTKTTSPQPPCKSCNCSPCSGSSCSGTCTSSCSGCSSSCHHQCCQCSECHGNQGAPCNQCSHCSQCGHGSHCSSCPHCPQCHSHGPNCPCNSHPPCPHPKSTSYRIEFATQPEHLKKDSAKKPAEPAQTPASEAPEDAASMESIFEASLPAQERTAFAALTPAGKLQYFKSVVGALAEAPAL